MSANVGQIELLERLDQKLDLILGFLAIRGIENDVNASIVRLKDLGLGTQAIAGVLGTTANAVAIRLTRMKK